MDTHIVCANCGIGFDALLDDACPACGTELSQDFLTRVRQRDAAERDAAQRAPAAWMPAIPITTGLDLPGVEITEVIGPVFAMTVRARNVFSQTGAKLKGVVGGEIGAMTKALERSRYETLVDLEQRALAVGADAVIGMRFDVGEMAGMWTEVCAYGTAVRTQPPSTRS